MGPTALRRCRRAVLGLAAAGLLHAGLAPGPAAAGPLVAVGSDTMRPLLEAWADARQAFDPALVLELETLGSSTGPPALIAGRAALAPMTRPMRPAERAAFEGRFGYAPTALRVAVDAVLVFVHEENTIDELALAEVDALYSSTRACGARDPVRRWGELGATGDWAGRSVRVCGRGQSSGTHAFFRQRALCGGRFRPDVLVQPGAASVERFVAEGLCGIGYGGLAARDADVKVLPISAAAGATAVEPADPAIFSGSYPLSRSLLIYVNAPPGGGIAPELDAFLRFALSEAGQAIVTRTGFLPLDAAGRQAELDKLSP